MEESILNNEEIYARMISEIRDYAIILMDTEGCIQNWNEGARRIKGYTKSDIIGKNFRLFYTDMDRENGKPDSLINQAKNEGRAQDEGWRVRKDGSTFWGSITITAVHDKKGNLVGYSKVTRDLTEKRNTDLALKNHVRELANKNRELAQFAYIASHDLQEPLRTVSTLTEMLSDHITGLDESGKQMMSYINIATSRMRQLIKGLLDYTRIGKQSVVTKINIDEMLKDLKNDLSPLIKDKDATLHIEEMPILNGYEVELRLMFQNLIINALKYSRPNEKPDINIFVKKEASRWVFAVQDNGIGIPDEYQKKIFLIFQRLHTKDEFEGTGIGLAHCQKIAELHKGKIWVESEAEKGSIFYFTINSNLKKN